VKFGRGILQLAAESGCGTQLELRRRLSFIIQ
jgi:hypothetical protein